MIHLAISTSSSYPTGYRDTNQLIQALMAYGIDASVQIWDDPSVEWSKFDAVLVHTTWDYMDKYDRFLIWCSEFSSHTSLINNYQIITANSTKHYLLSLQSKGVAIPTAQLVFKGDTPHPNSLEARFESQVVVKPVIDAGGNKAKLFPDVKLAHEYISRLSKEGDLFVQQYVQQISSIGEQSAIVIGGKLSHTVIKVPAEGEFRVQEYHGGLTTSTALSNDLEPYCLDILAKLGVNPVYARVDFINADKRLLMEVEMIEPDLFLRFASQSFTKLAAAIKLAIQTSSSSTAVS